MTKDADMKDKGLYPRGTTWWGRVVIPKELQGELGKGPIRASLRTGDPRVARLRLAELRAKHLAEFEAVRRRLNPSKVETVTPALVAALAAEIRRAILEADANMRSFPEGPAGLIAMQARRDGLDAPEDPETFPDSFDGLDDNQLDAVARFNAERSTKAGRSMAGTRTADVQGFANLAASHLGLVIDWASPSGKAALVECLKAYRLATADAQRRDSGEFIEIPAAVTPAPATQTKAPTLDDMREVWEKAEANRPPDTVRKMTRAGGLLAEFLKVPVVHMDQVTHAQAVDFGAWLLSRDTAAKTAKMSLDFVKTLFRLAKRRRVIAEDPFIEVRIKASSAAVREGWPIADLKVLFGTPLFTQYAVPRPGDSEAASKAALDGAYWVPLLCLFTGARVSEVCQLRVSDVLEVEGEEDPATRVTVIDITEDEADPDTGSRGQRTKTWSSVRRVPVHPTLATLGFLDYAAAIRDAGAAQLFPANNVPEGLPAGAYFSTWFGVFKRSLGYGRWDDLHNMRHTLRTRLAIAGLQESAIDALAGHADGNRGSIGRQVYTHWKRHPQALAREQARLTFPGLDLPKVYTAPAWKPVDPHRSPSTTATSRTASRRPGPASRS